jgi:hypothetical protein
MCLFFSNPELGTADRTPHLPSVQRQDIPKLVKIGASGQVDSGSGPKRNLLSPRFAFGKKVLILAAMVKSIDANNSSTRQ